MDDPAIALLLDDIRAGIQTLFGPRLLGLYLFGSLVLGGFNRRASDLDLLAVLDGEPSLHDLGGLDRLHHDLAHRHPDWDDRIEVAYVSAAGVQSFKERPSQIAIISPGEPLHLTEAGRDWLTNWYLVRLSNAPLFGPPPSNLIAPVTTAEYVEEVRAYACALASRTDWHGKRQAEVYAILTMCRALLTVRTGEHVSKEGAADWAEAALPVWAAVIKEAVQWRHTSTHPDEPPFGRTALTAAFVTWSAAQLNCPIGHREATVQA